MPEPVRRTVLITRPREDASRTAERVAAMGFAPLVAPFLSVRQVSPAMPARVQAVLVTSGNALAGLAMRDVPLLAVGDATAERARAAGFAIVHSAGRDAAALADLAKCVATPAAGPLLLACGARQGLSIAATLRAAGFTVIRRVTYAARPVRHFPEEAALALRNATMHAALFLSTETAVAFAHALPNALAASLTNVLALTIGKRAADSLDHLQWRQICVARAPTLDDVLALL